MREGGERESGSNLDPRLLHLDFTRINKSFVRVGVICTVFSINTCADLYVLLNVCMSSNAYRDIYRLVHIC